MSELGPSSFEQPRSMDSPGRNADMPFGNQEIYGSGIDPLGRKSEPAPPKDPIKRELFDRFGPDYDEGDISYDDLPDYGADTGHVDTEFFADPDQNAEHLESATAEVRHSIHQIEATQAVIAEHTGAHGQDLTDSVDRFLVDHAEHAVDIDASDKAEIVETTLIEGALESTGDRPEGTKNPINELEDQGYDQAVTDGVRKLFEEGATLPNGESAAEVVAQTVISNEMLQSEHYDEDSKEAGWDSPDRAQKLVEGYVTPGSKVLDIGIGTGQAVSGYAEKGATVIGLDRDESMLDAAGSIVGENGQLRQADINEALPITDLKESVDVAQAIGVLEFAEDLPAILDQVHGSLKENGVFVFTSELSDNGHAAKSHFEDIGLTVYRHSTDEIKGMLEKSGYTLLSSEAYDGYQREDGEVPYGIFLAQKQAEQAERPTAGDTLDAAMQQYMKGASKEAVLESTGMDPAELTKVIRGLPPETQEYLKERRKQSLAEAEQETTPESEQQGKNLEILRNSQMGETLEKAYLAAIEVDPRLADIVVVPMEAGDHRDAAARAAWAENNQSGKHEILLNLHDIPASLAKFEERMKDIPINTEKIAQTLGIDTSEVTPELLYVQSMIHEMGHTLEFMDYQEAGKTPDDHKHDRNTERQRLPLERSVTELEKHKDLVLEHWGELSKRASDKYSAHKHAEVSIDTFDGLASATADVYRDTKFEHAADKFAAEVLAKQPELVESLKAKTLVSSSETVAPAESTNPYERLTAEQLTAVRDNIANSIVNGIRKYDPAEVTRASANLAAIQREMQARSPEQPTHQRGEVDGAVTYITEPDTNVIQRIVSELQKIDGAPDIARKLYGGLEIPAPSEENQEARLQAMELQSLLAGVSREIRNVTGSEFSESTNPYASMKNEELATTVDRLKQTIQDLTAQGADTTDYRTRLAQIGEVIRNRS